MGSHEDVFGEPSWIEASASGARNPGSWIAAAERLKRASDILRETWLGDLSEMLSDLNETLRRVGAGESFPAHTPVLPPAVLLAGLAIEDALKGILIARDPDRFVQPRASSPDRLVDWGSRGHDLTWLMAEADVAASPEEAAVLRNLNDFIMWAGRYPVALRASEMTPTEGAPRASFDSSRFEVIDAIFGRTMSVLRESAAARDVQDRAERSELLIRRRDELMERLTAFDQVEEDGVMYFETQPETTEEGGPLVACVACGSTMRLRARRPAARCACGTLHYAEKRGVAGRMEWYTEVFPAAVD